MSNNVLAFKSWLDAYGQAWVNRSPEAAVALFTDDGTYRVTPFLAPLRGRKAIFEYWSEVARTEEHVKFDYEILTANSDLNIARWSASFVIVPPGLPTKLDGIFLISLDETGRCKSLQEWWHKEQEILAMSISDSGDTDHAFRGDTDQLIAIVGRVIAIARNIFHRTK